MISVIIPVYNTADYLQACLQSVQSQTLQDWECLLVDDGSTDGSGAICDQWAKKDTRFRVFHQENKGAAHARNFGMTHAHGEYLTFVDSDDSVHPDCLRSLLQALVEQNADLSVCGILQENKDEVSSFTPPDKAVISLGLGDIKTINTLNERFLLFGPFAKLYKKEWAADPSVRFDEHYSYGEDLLFNLAYLNAVQRIALVPKTLYRYRRHGNTLSTVFRPDQFVTDYTQWKALAAFYQKKGLCQNKDSQRYLYHRLWGIIYDGLFQYHKQQGDRYAYLKRILSIPEIDALKAHADSYDCASWIKRGILNRSVLPLFLFFMLFYRP